MKLLLALLPFLGCSAFLGPTSLNKNGVVKSFSSEPTKVTIQSMLKTIWKNGGEQSTDSYSYNVGSGRLSWGDREIQGFYPATKNTSSEGNFDGESGNPIVDWGGDRLINNTANEMFMMKIVAKNNIKITVGSNNSGNIGGWIEATELNYYVIEGELQNGNWYTDKQVKHLTMVDASTTYADVAATITLNAGNTYVFEWGAHESTERKWQDFSGMYFEFEETLAQETYAMSSIVVDVITSSGADVSKNIVNYNVKHGSYGDGNVLDFDGFEGALTTTSGDAQAENWKVQTQKGDGIIFTFDVKKNSLFKVYREVLGTEWIENADVNIYVNKNLVKSLTLVAGDLTQFNFEQFVGIGDYVAWEFTWSGEPHRLLAMLNGGDIITSMPKFEFTEVSSLDSQLWATTLTDDVNCDVTGATAPTFKNGMLWASFKLMYEALSETEQNKLIDAHYLPNSGSLVVTPIGDTTQEVANAMYIYDILINKYPSSFANFMNRTSLVAPRINVFNTFGEQSPVAIIVIISLLSVTAIGGFLVIRRRKEN